MTKTLVSVEKDKRAFRPRPSPVANGHHQGGTNREGLDQLVQSRRRRFCWRDHRTGTWPFYLNGAVFRTDGAVGSPDERQFRQKRECVRSTDPLIGAKQGRVRSTETLFGAKQ